MWHDYETYVPMKNSHGKQTAVSYIEVLFVRLKRSYFFYDTIAADGFTMWSVRSPECLILMLKDALSIKSNRDSHWSNCHTRQPSNENGLLLYDYYNMDQCHMLLHHLRPEFFCHAMPNGCIDCMYSAQCKCVTYTLLMWLALMSALPPLTANKLFPWYLKILWTGHTVWG